MLTLCFVSIQLPFNDFRLFILRLLHETYFQIRIATIKSTTDEKFGLLNGDQEPGYTIDIKPVDVSTLR